MIQCHCGSTKPWQVCCLPILSGLSQAETPEALMRSRYSAFCTLNIAYLKASSAGPALRQFDEASTTEWAKSVSFTGLNVISASQNGDEGQVTFLATYIENGQSCSLLEHSLFKRINGKWRYWSQI